MSSNHSNHSTASTPSSVSVAPLVLLSVVDHYNRVSQDTKKRVVGCVLGSTEEGTTRITNSFAIPFEEDDKNSDVWFLDHNYIESMHEMFRKINAKEKLIGWYHSGPKLRASDLKINEIFKKYSASPVLLVVDVKQEGVGIPTDCYVAVEEIRDDGSASEQTFQHIASTIQAEEAEEIGVEHLLRDIRDQAAGSLALRVTGQLKSLQGLQLKLRGITGYLERVLRGELPVNNDILSKLQDVFNLLPNLAEDNPLFQALAVKTNDELMVTYIASLVRSIIAFHDLIDNKLAQ